MCAMYFLHFSCLVLVLLELLLRFFTVAKYRNTNEVLTEQLSLLLIFLHTAPMSVKDVVQALVDDDLINCEKVGSSSYYWAFPSQALNVRQNKKKTLSEQISHCEAKRKKVEEAKLDAQKDRQPSVSKTWLINIVIVIFQFLTVYKMERNRGSFCVAQCFVTASSMFTMYSYSGLCLPFKLGLVRISIIFTIRTTDISVYLEFS